MKSKASQRNMVVRIITTPSRALRKARDYYVKSMTHYADNMYYSNVMAAGPSRAALPRSFSVSSAPTYENEDFRELIRASSARQTDNRVDPNSYVIPQMKVRSGSRGGPRAMPRSSSVAMGRIDEESPCYFGEDNIASARNEDKYSRSRSHAVTGGRLPAF